MPARVCIETISNVFIRCVRLEGCARQINFLLTNHSVWMRVRVRACECVPRVRTHATTCMIPAVRGGEGGQTRPTSPGMFLRCAQWSCGHGWYVTCACAIDANARIYGKRVEHIMGHVYRRVCVFIDDDALLEVGLGLGLPDNPKWRLPLNLGGKEYILNRWNLLYVDNNLNHFKEELLLSGGYHGGYQ